jgi:hypothetical protein
VNAKSAGSTATNRGAAHDLLHRGSLDPSMVSSIRKLSPRFH